MGDANEYNTMGRNMLCLREKGHFITPAKGRL